MQFNNSDYIAIASAIVALCALGTSLWQGYVTRTHNVLSVRPYLDLLISQKRGEPFGIEIQNNGTGPAILISIIAIVNGKSYDLSHEQPLIDLTSILVCKKLTYDATRFAHEARSVFPPTSIIPLLTITPTSGEDQFWNHINRTCKSLRIELRYRCIYGRSYMRLYADEKIQA